MIESEIKHLYGSHSFTAHNTLIVITNHFPCPDVGVFLINGAITHIVEIVENFLILV